MSSQKKLMLILCFVNPFVFLVGALFVVRQLDAELTQNFAYLGLVMICMLFQCMMSAGPISEGLVESCCKLPTVIANAFVGVQKQLSGMVKSAVSELIPGDDPLESLVELLADVLLGIFGPAIQTVAALLDPRKFLPAAFFSIVILAPLLGLFLFFLFLSTWGVLANFLVLKMGAVTMLVFWLMIALACLALVADSIVQMFIYGLQGVLNFLLRTMIMELVPVSALDPVMQQLGSDQSATELKVKIVESLRLDLKLDDEDEEEDPDKDTVMENLNDVFCGCFKSGDKATASKSNA